MTLEEYRSTNGLTYDALAALLGIEGKNRARTAQRYAKHERIPPLSALRRIEKATSGKVTPYDFQESGQRPVRAAAREGA